MKVAVLILGLAALAAAAPKPTNLNFRSLYKPPIKTVKATPRIIGGQEASPHSIPFQAFLIVYSGNSGWYCGGSLISVNYVLTAGHCGDGADLAFVILGAHRPLEDEDEDEVILTSSDVTVHENWDPETITNDVAVIRLPQSVSPTNAIATIRLPGAGDGTFAGTTARVSGWGLTRGDGTTISDVLNYVDVQVISQSECEDIFGQLASSILCTSGAQNTGACSGDSGGPLVENGVQIGVVSFGLENCPAGYPSAFSRVTSFVNWITSHTDV